MLIRVDKFPMGGLLPRASSQKPTAQRSCRGASSWNCRSWGNLMPKHEQARFLNRFYFTRARILHETLDSLDGPVDALEVGRLRDERETCGHSTLHIAVHPNIRRLTSVDIEPYTEKVCRGFLPQSALEKIEFVNADAVPWLSQLVATDGRRFGFFYLDGLNDADHCRAVLVECQALAEPGAIFILDDTDSPDVAEKGVLTRAYVETHPEVFEIVREVPHDATCHGQTVIRYRG